MTKNRQVIATSEAAKILNEDPRTVQRKAKAGEYQATKLPGLRGAYVFERSYIQRVARKRQARAAA